MDKSSEAMAALLEQYKILSDDIRSLEAMSEKILGVGFTLISASLVYCFKEKIEIVYFIATPAYLGLLLFISNQYHSVFWKGGHKRFLEMKYNDLLGMEIMLWEGLAQYRKKRITFSNTMFGAFLLLALVAFFVYSVSSIASNFGAVWAYIFGGVNFFLISVLGLSVWDGSQKFEAGLKASIQLCTDLSEVREMT